jgi:hypothetical protein
MTINGKIIDDKTGQPVPRATIALLNSNVQLISNAADDNGNFSISTSQVPDSLLVSSVGYQATFWPLPQYQSNTVFDLPISNDPLSTVIIQYQPKKKFPWLLVALGIIIFSRKKKKYAHSR